MGELVGFDLSGLEVLLKAHDIPQYEWRFVLEKIGVLTRIAMKYSKDVKDK